MEEIKKIKLNEEQQVENNGNDVKNPKRLKPGGGGDSGSGSGSGEEYSNVTMVLANGEYSSGGFKWNVAVSAAVSISVSYVWDEYLEELVFNEATIACSNVCATFGGTTQGSVNSGIIYESVSPVPSVPPTGGGNVTQNTLSPVTVSAGSYALVGFIKHYDGNGNPVGEPERQNINASLSISIGFASDPYLGIFGVSASLA